MPYAKALVGAAIAVLSSIAAGLVDDNLDTNEWLTAIVAGLVALGAVYAVPNRDSNG